MSDPTDKTVPGLVDELTVAGTPSTRYGVLPSRKLYIEAASHIQFLEWQLKIAREASVILVGDEAATATYRKLRTEKEAAVTELQSLTEGYRQLQDSLHEAQQRNAELSGQVRVAYGFDRDAVFANIDKLTSRAEAAEQRNAELEGALAELVSEANRLGPQLPYNAPTKDIAMAIERAKAALKSAPQAGEVQNRSSQESPSVRPQAAPREVRPIDAEMTKFLCGVVGVVEAAPYEQHMLWDENSRRDPPKTWKQNSCGLMEIVGHLGEMPVCISLFTVEVGGHKLLFMNPTSQVVDHEMIRTWMKATLPKSAFRPDGYINCTDAMNFHNVFPRALPPAENGLSGCEQDEQRNETRDDLNSIQAGGEDHE